jgi:HSP20 family protein
MSHLTARPGTKGVSRGERLCSARSRDTINTAPSPESRPTFMTLSTPFSMIHPSSNTSPAHPFRSLDRALAAKYVRLVLAHRRRVAAAHSHGGEIMRPRCVPSFLSPSTLTFLNPASVEICDQPQSRFVSATFELPGLKKEEIGVHLTHDGRLTISGTRRPPPFLANADPTFVVYPVKEIKYGRFERTINVPAGLEVSPLLWLYMECSVTGAGEGHKCVFGRWHALCFLATHRFSPCASSRTNTSYWHGLNCLGSMRGLSYNRHHSWKTPFFGINIFRPSHMLLCRVKSALPTLTPCICPCHGCHKLPNRSLSTCLLASLGGHRHSLLDQFRPSVITLVLASPEDFTIQKTIVSICQDSSGCVITNTVPQLWPCLPPYFRQRRVIMLALPTTHPFACIEMSQFVISNCIPTLRRLFNVDLIGFHNHVSSVPLNSAPDIDIIYSVVICELLLGYIPIFCFISGHHLGRTPISVISVYPNIRLPL